MVAASRSGSYSYGRIVGVYTQSRTSALARPKCEVCELSSLARASAARYVYAGAELPLTTAAERNTSIAAVSLLLMAILLGRDIDIYTLLYL